MNYVAGYRMLGAERVLLESKMTIVQIAAGLGYATEAAFRRAFKRVSGTNAADLRRSPRPGGR